MQSPTKLTPDQHRLALAVFEVIKDAGTHLTITNRLVEWLVTAEGQRLVTSASHLAASVTAASGVQLAGLLTQLAEAHDEAIDKLKTVCTGQEAKLLQLADDVAMIARTIGTVLGDGPSWPAATTFDRLACIDATWRLDEKGGK